MVKLTRFTPQGHQPSRRCFPSSVAPDVVGYFGGGIPHGGVASLVRDVWGGLLMLVQLNDIGDDLRDFGAVEGRAAT